MASEILSGEIEKYYEPRSNDEYEALTLPSSITLDFVPETFSIKKQNEINEITVHVKISELNEVRLPIDANPRKPEKLPVVEIIQKSATEDSPKYFVFKNNGMDVFCSSIKKNPDNENNLLIDFGPPEEKDGICNGGLTYYALQKLLKPHEEAQVKIRFYTFEGESIPMKREIAKAKNRNRAVSSSDDANFMGYFDRIKQQLDDYQKYIKWETGDVELETEFPIDIATFIRYISAIQIGDNTFHWDQNPEENLLTSHKRRNNLLTSATTHMNRFIKEMEG